MRLRGHRKSITFFITLGACLVGLAVTLNVSWVLLNWRKVALLVLGVSFFCVIIAGLILNTIFLVREIRRNEQHDAFINAVSHELKTPIASIRLYLETLKRHDLEPQKRAEFYDICLADTDRLLYTVEQVLRAGTVTHRRSRNDEELVDLRETARDCLDLARTRYPHLPPNSFHFADASDGGERALVKGSADDLRIAVTNLIDNAVKYSGERAQVSLSVEVVGERQLEVRVSDSGVGIPRAELKRIFRRFYRAPGRLVAQIKGTGLGLFIVQSIVRKHGGSIVAESEGEGRGSTFTIRLPRAAG
ncbi:MAG TPA: HAMP domain-containing sensor histidine kinase [Pyrinomonadaceae bacterium]|jgi:signal transduction histidine kinase|nr:HAMP domain-containing sensor histidine kinase [Pyrinomonadaceae bacterium]